MKHTWINTAYPFEHTTAEKWNTIFTTSIFLSLIMLLLQPFGFTAFSRLQLFGGYGAIALLTLLINYFGAPYLFPGFFADTNWSIPKAFLFLSYNFVVIGFWIHVFNGLILRNDPIFLVSGVELGTTILKILLLGGIASTFLILIRYNFLTRKHLQLSQDLNQQFQGQLLKDIQSSEKEIQLIQLELEGKSIAINRKDLLFVRAEGNYLAFHSRTTNKKSSQLYRGRIKQVEDLLEAYPEFFRCHRSYIVNLHHIASTRGNSQGLSIKMQDGNERIPVSRPNIKSFKLRLEGKMARA